MKLSTKLTFGSMILVALAVLWITLFSIRRQTRLLHSQLITGKQQLVAEIADAARNAFQSLNWLFMEEMLKNTAEAEDVVFCQLVKPDSTIYLADKRQDYGKTVCPHVRKETDGVIDHACPGMGETRRIVVKPVEIGGETWKIALGVSFRGIDRANRVMIEQSLLGAVAVLVLTGLFAYFLSQGLTRPVAELAQAATRVADGDLEHSVEIDSKDEVGALARNFNKMISSLRVSRDELRMYSQNLETMVEERTAELVEATQKTQELYHRLRETQSQLVMQEKLASVGQLAAGVAHEINNPVGFVMSNLGTLSEYVGVFKVLLSQYEQLVPIVKAENVAEADAILEEIEETRANEDLSQILQDVDHLLTECIEGADRVKEIVQGLKSFARVDEAEMKEADINEGIEATLKIVSNELKYKCTVHKKLGPLPQIHCYPGQLNQVFVNLLMNAAQAIPDRGDITIETEATDTDVVLRISDTGQGIPLANLSKLFDPFFTTKPVGQGTGLGLAISHGIIEKHNGTIEVESEVGKGTTFTIRLPLEGVGNEAEVSQVGV